MKVRGVTPEEREQARLRRTAERRAAFYRQRIGAAAGNAARQVEYACDYVRAIANDLTPGQRVALAREVTQLADRYNTQ